MPEEICSYLQETPIHILNKGKIDKGLLEEVFRIVYRQSGHDFHYYKTPTIIRRISRRMSHKNIKKLEQYVAYLKEHPEEGKSLCKDLLIGVTKFFRDPAVFEILNNDILPDIIRKKNSGDALKVWIAVCSTGEEAYSVAISIDRYLTAMQLWMDVKIFATDIDETALEVASKGIYPITIEKDVEADVLEKYFVKDGNQYTIAQHIRKQIVFARHNIIKDPPFIKNDIASCRNMLIYMNPILQKKVMSTLHFSLTHGGYLVLGPSETANYMMDSLEEINSKWKIYRKDGTQSMLNPDALYSRIPGLGRFSRDIRPGYKASKLKAVPDINSDFREVMANEFGYAVFYLDGNGDIKEATGSYTKYITFPEGTLNMNIMKMLPPELSVALNSALRKALMEQKQVQVKNVRVKSKSRNRYVCILVKPGNIDMPNSQSLVILWESKRERDNGKASQAVNAAAEPELNRYIIDLESELKEMRTELQFAVEGLETTNEELQSSNEELLSANEELQSSNEELQSLNEELHTLNTEHQLKIKELVELNDDLNNYFRSADIAQIFVDKKMQIRKFNPAAVRMINLIESDIGRPIGHMSTNLRYEGLTQDIRDVINTGKAVEKEIRLHSGRSTLLRVLPYIRQDQQQDGVVITFVDISALREKDDIIKGVFDSSQNAIMVFNAVRDQQGDIEDFRWMEANYAANLLTGKESGALTGKSLKKEFPQVFEGAFFEKYTKVVKDGMPLHFEYNYRTSDIDQWFDVTGVKMNDGLVVTISDITEKKQAEEKLKRNYAELMTAKENLRNLNLQLEIKVKDRTQEVTSNIEQRKFLAESMPLIVWTATPEGNLNFLNKEFERYTGLSIKDGLEWGWAKIIHPEDHPPMDKVWRRALQERSDFSAELRLKNRSGEYCWHIIKGSPKTDNDGQVMLWVGTFMEIHEQKVANEILDLRVRERTAELQQMNTELESSNMELQQFASVASHDLKEPLRKIHVFSNLIKDKYFRQTEHDALDYLDRIINSSARMTALVNDLLSFSRLSVNHLFKPTDLNQLLQDILADLELVIEEKQAVIKIDALPEIDAVPGQMRQVFQNLLSNALKFSGKGQTPVITIGSERVAAKSIDSPVEPAGNFCRITVADNGIGFDEQYREKIFTIFQRLHTKEKYEGTGIGLAIARKIIEKHNGLIAASGVEQQGATFVLILPIVQMADGTIPQKKGLK